MEIQEYLQDLLTIDCEIQTKFQQLNQIKAHSTLETKSNEVKQLLKDYKEKLNDMKQFFNLTKTSTNQDVYLKELQSHSEHLSRLESKFRSIYFTTKTDITRTEHDQLFNNNTSSGDESSSNLKSRKIDKEILDKQSSHITHSLNDLNRVIKSTLLQSDGTIRTLATSSSAIDDTKREFESMSSNINDAKRLINKYDQREFTNKLLFIFSLILFFSVVLYIIWKRLF